MSTSENGLNQMKTVCENPKLTETSEADGASRTSPSACLPDQSSLSFPSHGTLLHGVFLFHPDMNPLGWRRKRATD